MMSYSISHPRPHDSAGSSSYGKRRGRFKSSSEKHSVSQKNWGQDFLPSKLSVITFKFSWTINQ